MSEIINNQQLLERDDLVVRCSLLVDRRSKLSDEQRATSDEQRTTKFDDLALDVFNYQYKYNAFFSQFCDLIDKKPTQINSIAELPFLPITFFKNKILKTGDWKTEIQFLSSGTTGVITSSHHVKSTDWYNAITKNGFESFYGSLKNYCILGLLPAYLERPGSSLVHMVDYFIGQSAHPQSGFFLYNQADLKLILEDTARTKTPTILFGVTFALLDFVEKYTLQLPDLIIIETGGMKGRRKEIIRSELHEKLRKGFGAKKIHSEYGMTELLSQAYLVDSCALLVDSCQLTVDSLRAINVCQLSTDNCQLNALSTVNEQRTTRFEPIATMKVLSRDVTDPFSIFPLDPKKNKSPTGALNIIDLANIDTCSFIATDDLGKVYADGSFEVLGRMDNSDVRGCALLMVNG